jgi:hypothetical protein
MKLLKNINEKSKVFLISFLMIFFLIIFFYFIPNFLNTFLGNLIIILLSFLIDIRLGILTIIFIVIINIFSKLHTNKEGFIWKQGTTNNFLEIQNTINPGIIFDVNLIQKNQASQEEIDYFNKFKKWPWSEKTKELYINAIKRNPFVKNSPESSLNYTRTVYNEAAILMILSYQTKEGQFLINGILVRDPSGNKMESLPSGFGDYPYFSGLINNKMDDVIKCNMTNPNNAILEKTKYTGKGGIYGQQNSVVTPIDYNKLENLIPGFTFLNGPCNPCGAINVKPDYSCPFKLVVKNKPPFISDVFQYLWNISDNPLQSMPSFLSENINPNEYPLLSELQSELLKQENYIKK